MSEECKWLEVCPIVRSQREGVLDEDWIKKYCKGDFKKCARYEMMEEGERPPNNMMPDGEINEDL